MNLDQKLKDLWNGNKLAFWLLVIPLGLCIVAYKFRSALIDLLVKDSRKIAIETEKQDDALAQQQAAAAAQAAQLVQQAQDLGKDKKPVGEDWNKQ